MKKLYVIFATLLLFFTTQAQTYQQKLYYTCKVWGFVKYFHSRVSVGSVNWDSVLLHCLPLVKSAVTKNDFNNALDTMLNAAGPMAIAVTPRTDTMAPELKRNINFGWINDTMLRADVQVILDTIKNNFRPHGECWVQNNQYTTSYGGWLVFPHDSLMLNQNTYTNFPDEWHKLMVLFKEWNIINYFNPYKYIHTKPWDSALYNTVMVTDNASNDMKLYLAFRKLTAQNEDAHTEGLTGDGYQLFPFGYSIPLILRHIPGMYVVVKSAVPAIHVGDQILSIQGLTTKQWEDSLGPYISAGDSDVFRRFVAQYMVCSPNYYVTEKIFYKDSVGNTLSTYGPTDSVYYNSWFYSYYPNDTLATANYRYWPPCNIGYVNMGQLQQADVPAMYSALSGASAIIFDIRNYPNGTAWPIANLMYSNAMGFAKLQIPDTSFPGTYFWVTDSLGVNGNPNPYTGKIIILVNEETQSQAEYSCMILKAMPNVTVIGSHTAATDGNITYYRLSQYVQTGFSTLGVFYPNGDSTEGIGIVPDTVMYPTQIGIRHKRDELLEKALNMVGCTMSTQNLTAVKPGIVVYPNPSKGEFTFEVKSEVPIAIGIRVKNDIVIYNSLGQEIYESTMSESVKQIDLSGQSAGVYFYRVLSEEGNLIGEGKLVIE